MVKRIAAQGFSGSIKGARGVLKWKEMKVNANAHPKLCVIYGAWNYYP